MLRNVNVEGRTCEQASREDGYELEYLDQCVLLKVGPCLYLSPPAAIGCYSTRYTASQPSYCSTSSGDLNCGLNVSSNQL
jgi:hypothetical protein